MEPDRHDHSQPSHTKDPHVADLGRRGGQKRMAQLSFAERSALSKHALRARWHRRQFNEEQARAREITYAVIQTLKEKQPPLI
jgi:hypothetical protein